MIGTAYRWLVAQGLYHDVVAAVIAAVIAKAIGLHKRVKKMLTLLHLIADRLDTDTAGGLADIKRIYDEIAGEAPRGPRK